MTKTDAIKIFGTTVTEMARALGITRSAASQWPEELRQEQMDRVIGAAVRLGLRPDCSTPPHTSASVTSIAA